MVRRVPMVVGGIGLLSAWFVLCAAAGAARLSVTVPQHDLAYGQALTITLQAADTGASLDSIDLDPLREDFLLEPLPANTSGNGGSSPTRQIVLRPRRSGELHIPALWFAGARSEPVPIHVGPARDGGYPVQVGSRVSAASVWARQQVLVTVEVRSTNRFFEVRAPAFRDPGSSVVALQTETRSEHIDGADYTVKSTGWALYPARSGRTTLDLPLIEYLRGGRVQARFALPRLTFDVRPLPPYVPANMPVGTVTLSSAIDAPAVLNTDSLGFWQIEARGQDLPAAALPSMLAPVRDRRRLQFLPAEPERGQRSGSDGVQSTLAYRIPFVAAGSGRVTLPALQLQYFDPDSGRIVRVATPPVPIWVVGTGWRITLIVLLLTAAAYGTLRALGMVRTRLARARRRRAVLQEIASAPDARGLRAALNRFGWAEGWRLDGSLRAWLAGFRTHYRRVDARLDSVCAALNRREFAPSGTDTDLTQLRAALATALQTARPRRTTRDAPEFSPLD